MKSPVLSAIMLLFICQGFVSCDGKKCTRFDTDQPYAAQCIRGDVNRNMIAYEIADAVLLATYFVEGISVFTYDKAYQVCATDVNADGRTLTLSDLVYLVRIILHDAIADPTPSSDIAFVIVSENTIGVECDSPIGAILFEFDGGIDPILLATDMEMRHKGNKVLVWSSIGNSFDKPGLVLGFVDDFELVVASTVDRDSRPLESAIRR